MLDIPINHKLIPTYRKKRKIPKILREEELKVFFNACENYKYKTIFMMICIFFCPKLLTYYGKSDTILKRM